MRGTVGERKEEFTNQFCRGREKCVTKMKNELHGVKRQEILKLLPVEYLPQKYYLKTQFKDHLPNQKNK